MDPIIIPGALMVVSMMLLVCGVNSTRLSHLVSKLRASNAELIETNRKLLAMNEQLQDQVVEANAIMKAMER